VPGDDTFKSETVHVVARTSSHKKYFYRKLENGFWTPWEPIQLDIDDTPVMPVVWQDRLLLFWLKVTLEPQPLPPNTSPLAGTGSIATMKANELKVLTAPILVKAMLCWSEHFNGSWQPSKTSGTDVQADLGTNPEPKIDRSQLRLDVIENDKSLRIGVSFNRSASFVLFNTHSPPVLENPAPFDPSIVSGGVVVAVARQLQLQGPSRQVLAHKFAPSFEVQYGTADMMWTFPLFQQKTQATAIQPQHPVPDPWTAPFIYADSEHAFFVRSTATTGMVGFENIFEGLVSTNPRSNELAPVFGPPVPIPPRPNFDFGAPNGGVFDPAPMRRLLSEDVQIRHGLGITGSIAFDDAEIGPTGAINPRTTEG
jgi:hypothetical protein